MSKTRIQFKTDTVENWDDSFSPLEGELCIFSNYSDTGLINHLGNKIYRPNIKIGTKNKKILDLPFLSNSYITEEEIQNLFKSDDTTPILGTMKLNSAILA